MENDPDLAAFNNWRAEQADAERTGLVFAASDHAAKTCSVWWAGPETDFLDRMRTQARARGITLLVNRRSITRRVQTCRQPDRRHCARFGITTKPKLEPAT